MRPLGSLSGKQREEIEVVVLAISSLLETPAQVNASNVHFLQNRFLRSMDTKKRISRPLISENAK